MSRIRRLPLVAALGLLALAAALPLVPSFDSAGAQSPATVPSDWALIPEGVKPGQSFRLLFVTSTTTTASSSDIADYNLFVRAAAAGNSSLSAFSNGFTALISTATVDARDNTATTGAGVPIHWLGGAKAADDYADLYDKSWDSVAGKTERGGSYTGLVWTGGNKAGGKSGARYAGAAEVRLGSLADPTLPLSSPNAAAASDSYPLYALSPVLTVAQPQQTVADRPGRVILGIGGGGLRAGQPLTAVLEDPDGASAVSWSWARSADQANWQTIAGATGARYTPASDDVGQYLRATASYTDGHGPGKTAQSTTPSPVAPAQREGQSQKLTGTITSGTTKINVADLSNSNFSNTNSFTVCVGETGCTTTSTGGVAAGTKITSVGITVQSNGQVDYDGTVIDGKVLKVSAWFGAVLLRTATITVTPLPTIDSLAARVDSGTRVTLTWTNPSTCTTQAPVCGYQYRHRPEGGAWTSWTAVSPASLTTQTVTGLSGTTSYEFGVQRVQGGNVLGRGTVTATTYPILWTATLTVDESSQGFGCLNVAATHANCYDPSVLTDDDFTFQGTDYEVGAFLLSTSGDKLSVGFDKDLPADLSGATLHVDGKSFAFADDTNSSARQLDWSNPGLTWTNGQQVSLSLTMPTCPASVSVCVTSVEYASYPPNGQYYRAGDTIAVAVNFTGDLDTGTDRVELNLDIGGQQAVAELNAGAGTDRLVFTYVVDEFEADADGFTVPAGFVITPNKPQSLKRYENINLRLRNINRSGQSDQVVRGYEDILTATLTVKNVGDQRGCDDDHTNTCTINLSSRFFTHLGTDYRVTLLQYDFVGSKAGQFSIGFDKRVPDSGRDALTLHLSYDVVDKEFELSEGTWFPSADGHFLDFGNSGIIWSDNQRVEVKLRAPNGPWERRFEERPYVDEVTCEPDGSRCWVPPNWALIPKKLTPKEAPFPIQDFRLMFVSEPSKIAATSRHISAYNDFVQGLTNYHDALEAVKPHVRALANAVEGDDLHTNTRTRLDTASQAGDPGSWSPIYWVKSVKAADSYADLYDGGWDSTAEKAVAYPGGRLSTSSLEAWTGSHEDGTPYDGALLGDLSAIYGDALTPGKEFSSTDADNTETRQIYAITPLLSISRAPHRPGAPTGFTATGESAGAGKIVLSWDAPPQPGLTRYQYRLSDTAKWHDLTGIEQGDAEWTVTWAQFPATDTRDARPLKSGKHKVYLRAISRDNDRLRSSGIATEFELEIAAAKVTKVEIISRPLHGDTYQVGETVQAAVHFSRPVRCQQPGRIQLRFLSGHDPQTFLDLALDSRLCESFYTDRLEFELAVPEGFSTVGGLVTDDQQCLLLKGKAKIEDADGNAMKKDSTNNGVLACDDPGADVPASWPKHRVGTPTVPVVMVAADSGIVPSGLQSGDRFRLLFVSGNQAPTNNTDIRAYNGWVQRLALTNESLKPHHGHFRAVVSTRTVDARANIAMAVNPSAPVYWVGGAKVADDMLGFCGRRQVVATGGTPGVVPLRPDWKSYAAVNETGYRYEVGPMVMTGSDFGCWKDPTGRYAGNFWYGGDGVRFGVRRGIVDPDFRHNPISHSDSLAPTMRIYGLSLVFQVK